MPRKKKTKVRISNRNQQQVNIFLDAIKKRKRNKRKKRNQGATQVSFTPTIRFANDAGVTQPLKPDAIQGSVSRLETLLSNQINDRFVDREAHVATRYSAPLETPRAERTPREARTPTSPPLIPQNANIFRITHPQIIRRLGLNPDRDVGAREIYVALRRSGNTVEGLRWPDVAQRLLNNSFQLPLR